MGKEKIYLGFLLGFWLLQLLCGAGLLYIVGINQNALLLQDIQSRLHDDVTYRDGKWDTYRYNADPSVPGNAYSVYMITTDGFVIERWHPIQGLLDTSDFKHLLQLQTPQTITTITNQTWRVFSLPIQQSGSVIGVITVSSFTPTDMDMGQIDSALEDNAHVILDHLTVKNGIISARNLDVRAIPYTLSFQVVNQFNKIIVKNNNFNSIDRLPNFIDPSYVDNALHSPHERVVADSLTGEHYYVVTSALTDAKGTVRGVIVVTKSISYLYHLLLWYFIGQLGVGILSSVVLSWYVTLHPLTPAKEKPLTFVHFDKKTSVLSLNEFDMVIPFATNQYYLCEAICAHPKKKWEVGELLDRFGIEASSENARKVYDAMLLLNKKIMTVQSKRLVMMQDRRYFCNPELAALISS